MTIRTWRYSEKYDSASDYKGQLPDLGTRAGSFAWSMTPGTPPASAENMYIFNAVNSQAPGESYIRCYFSGASSVTLSFNDGVNSASGGCDAATLGVLSTAVEYQMRVQYNHAGNTLELDIDGTNVISVDTDKIRFDAQLDRYYLGGNSSGGANGVYTSTTFSEPNLDYWLF